MLAKMWPQGNPRVKEKYPIFISSEIGGMILCIFFIWVGIFLLLFNLLEAKTCLKIEIFKTHTQWRIYIKSCHKPISSAFGPIFVEIGLSCKFMCDSWVIFRQFLRTLARSFSWYYNYVFWGKSLQIFDGLFGISWRRYEMLLEKFFRLNFWDNFWQFSGRT